MKTFKGYEIEIWFEMPLTFKLMVDMFGKNENHTPIFTNTVQVKNKFLDIPDKEYLEKMAKILLETFNKNSEQQYYALDCKFQCFKNIVPCEITVDI